MKSLVSCHMTLIFLNKLENSNFFFLSKHSIGGENARLFFQSGNSDTNPSFKMHCDLLVECFAADQYYFTLL